MSTAYRPRDQTLRGADSFWYRALAMHGRSFTLLVLTATLLGLALRLQDLGRESLWYDEVTQLEWTNVPFTTFVADRWRQVDPPLNELVAWSWNSALRAAGPHVTDREELVRPPVVAFGV